MSHSSVPYEPLALDDAVPPSPSAYHSRTTIRAWTSFLAACALSLVLSTFNLSAISAVTSFNAISHRATKTPSVYLGLERVKLEQPMCRGRGSFPKTFYTFEGNDWQYKTHVHAPGDKINLRFGGRTSAILDFYLPDYALENCTLTAQGFARSDSEFELFRLDDVSGDLNAAEPLGNLNFRAHPTNFELSTKPFYCPSRTHLLILWTCPAPNCVVDFPLEGVTHMTAGDKSRLATGLRLTQWEHLHCIPEQ